MERISSGRDFRRIYREGMSVGDRYIAIKYAAHEKPKARAGFVVAKEVGNAVCRNRVKRLLKEAYRANRHRVKRGYELVIVARKEIAGLKLVQIEESLVKNLEKANLLLINDTHNC